VIGHRGGQVGTKGAVTATVNLAKLAPPGPVA
jgi:hypothetical protein